MKPLIETKKENGQAREKVEERESDENRKEV
jgi:hypothetical protein